MILRILSSYVLILGLYGCPGDPSNSNLSDSVSIDIPIGLDEQAKPVDVTVNECGCNDNFHCVDEECVPDVCAQGVTSCFSVSEQKVCSDDGSGFEVIPCPGETVCYLGNCLFKICDPQAQPICQNGKRVSCNSLGVGYNDFPCPGGTECKDGACVPIEANILLVVDTSSSMNVMVSTGSSPENCISNDGDCPPWLYPNCDDPSNPYTRMGKVKSSLDALVDSEFMSNVRLGLQRFPQRHHTLANMHCNVTFYLGQPTISGDNDGHITAIDGWFGQNIEQTIAVPFPEDQSSNSLAIRSWFDFVETPSPIGGACSSNDDCPGKFCWGEPGSKTCHELSNHELRGTGSSTPIGKSIFYAGEYFRHHVLVEGKPCIQDSDCRSPHHTCIADKCHDFNAHCRPNVIILFTDGLETQNQDINNFFHPRVQAKRLHFGLGCDEQEDCLAGATCIEGSCIAPDGVLPEEPFACTAGGTPCQTTNDCPNPCSGVPCQGECRQASVDYIDPGFANRMVDYGGTPVSLTIHVVDASEVPNANRLIAAYGGGLQVSVDLANPEDLLTKVGNVIQDVKSANTCR